MITTSRARLGSLVTLVADASLSALSERVHRGSLANARRAIEETRAAEAQSQAVLAQLREFESLGRHALAVSS